MRSGPLVALVRTYVTDRTNAAVLCSLAVACGFLAADAYRQPSPWLWLGFCAITGTAGALGVGFSVRAAFYLGASEECPPQEPGT